MWDEALKQKTLRIKSLYQNRFGNQLYMLQVLLIFMQEMERIMVVRTIQELWIHFSVNQNFCSL